MKCWLKIILPLAFLICAEFIYAQNNVKQSGDFFFYWGYNRSAYTKSDIHLFGDNYDFTLKSVSASDRPSKLDFDTYLHIQKFTIPQYNYRIGCFLNDRIAVSLGMDHLKYVMNPNQSVAASGYINGNEKYENTFTGEQTVNVGNDFVYIEHSDGLNYASLDIDYFLPIAASKDSRFDLQLLGGVGLGVYIPKTLVVIMDEKLDNRFHISGLGLNVKTGLRAKFFSHFFYEMTFKSGQAWLPKVLTTEIGTAQASHNFGWIELYAALGFKLSLNRNKNTNSESI